MMGLAAAVRDSAREIAAELFEFHELAYEITRRDILLRYKHAVMGFFWAICIPVVQMIVFGLVFTRIARIDVGYPYAVYAYTGLLPWALFASSLRFAANSLVSNAVLIKKVYFPREILPYSAVLVSLVDFLVASIVLAGLIAFYRIPLQATVLFVPVLLFIELLFTAAVSLILAMATLFFRDVKYLVDLGLTVWMFATPVVYPVDQVHGVVKTVLRLNPMTPIVEGYRDVILRGRLPDMPALAAAAIIAAVLFVLASLSFHWAESQFAERA